MKIIGIIPSEYRFSRGGKFYLVYFNGRILYSSLFTVVIILLETQKNKSIQNHLFFIPSL